MRPGRKPRDPPEGQAFTRRWPDDEHDPRALGEGRAHGLAWPRRLPPTGPRPVLPGQYVGRVSAPDRDGQTRMRALPGADSVPALGTRRWTGFRHLGRHNRGRTARHAVRAGAALNGPIVTGSAAKACMPGCAAISRNDRPGLADHSPRGRAHGEYEVYYICVNWPHHVFVNQNFKVIGAN